MPTLSQKIKKAIPCLKSSQVQPETEADNEKLNWSGISDYKNFENNEQRLLKSPKGSKNSSPTNLQQNVQQQFQNNMPTDIDLAQSTTALNRVLKQ